MGKIKIKGKSKKAKVERQNSKGKRGKKPERRIKFKVKRPKGKVQRESSWLSVISKINLLRKLSPTVNDGLI